MSTRVAQDITAPTSKPPKKGSVKERVVEGARTAVASTSKVKINKGEPEENEDNKSAATSEDEDPADEGESELEEDAAAASKRYLRISEWEPLRLLTYPSAQTRHCRGSKRLMSKVVGKLATSTSFFFFLELLLK